MGRLEVEVEELPMLTLQFRSGRQPAACNQPPQRASLGPQQSQEDIR
jgi:hypothetical protein